MSSDDNTFSLEEESLEDVERYCNEKNVPFLCIIAPFAPLRIAPERILTARFSYPDEFILDEFVTKVIETYPRKEDRPTLHLLIHSPGGAVSSSYMVARVLRNTFNNIIGYIPHIAASGATILALSCNEVVMGHISRLTGIDPYYVIEGEITRPLSLVRAFDHLQDILGTMTLGEISYPYQHLVKTITAEKYDEATHNLKMVEKYTTELMEKSGYETPSIKNIIDGVLYEVESHEEVIPYDKAQEMGINVKFADDISYNECWEVMQSWLRQYYLRPSPVHIIKYRLPEVDRSPEPTSGSLNKEEKERLN